MPLYDLKCTRCGTVVEKLFTTAINFLSLEEFRKKVERIRARRKAKFEKENPGWGLIDTTPDQIGEIDYYSKEDILKYKRHAQWQICEVCGGFQEVQPIRTNMQPDNMWAGVNTERGYYTSKSQYQQELKNKGIESVTVGELHKINNNVKKVRAEKRQTQLNNLTEHIHKELAGVEISPDGNTVKQKRTYLRKRK